MKPIIEVIDVSKEYKIKTGIAASTISEGISHFLRSPLKSVFKKDSSKFLALNKVNFNVYSGEVIGLIGKNGAGKSTLLKIFSRITPPTKGQIILRGKSASLLEVGTGFHPELTGKENIFLNGAILGMSRKEILSRYDDIVSFAEVEDFIEMPVKHYSSGMYTRLAFSVAAHLTPEILIVDEVLSVGDSAFQKKSLLKMKQISKSGRTVFFVSHNLLAIANLCTKVIYLRNGKVVTIGKPKTVINKYINDEKGREIMTEASGSNVENDFIKIIAVNIADNKGKNDNIFYTNMDIHVLVTYFVKMAPIKVICNFELINNDGVIVFSTVEDNEPKLKQTGSYKSVSEIPKDLLPEGLFSIKLTITTIFHENIQDLLLKSDLHFEVINTLDKNMAQEFVYFGKGVIQPKLKWNRNRIDKPK